CRPAHGRGHLLRARVWSPGGRGDLRGPRDRRLVVPRLRARRRARTARTEAPPPRPRDAAVLRTSVSTLVPARGGEPARAGDRPRLVQRRRWLGPPECVCGPPGAVQALLTARPAVCYPGAQWRPRAGSPGVAASSRPQ